MTLLLLAGLLTWLLQAFIGTNAAGTCLLFLFSFVVVSMTAFSK